MEIEKGDGAVGPATETGGEAGHVIVIGGEAGQETVTGGGGEVGLGIGEIGGKISSCECSCMRYYLPPGPEIEKKEEGRRQHMPKGKRKGLGREKIINQSAGRTQPFGMLPPGDLNTFLLCNTRLCKVSSALVSTKARS